MSNFEVGQTVKITVKNDGNVTSSHVKSYTGRVSWVGPVVNGDQNIQVALAPKFKAQRFVNLRRESAEIL